jgi:o-succinylbenzoate synthase
VIQLRAVTLREIRLPLREPFRISSGSVQDRRILLLELEDVEGVSTWSECVAPELPYYSSEAIDTAWLALRDWLVPPVLGRPFQHPSEVHRALEQVARGHRMAKAALEMGCWGLAAEKAEEPLARLLGGTRQALDVGVSLGITDAPEALAERARHEAAAGYRKIKLKIRPRADLEYVAAVREALPDTDLMVDANAAYRLQDWPHLVELDAFGLTMVEQPLDGEDLVRHARLQERMKTPICLDESITGLDRAEDMIALGSARIINIKAGRVGGLSSAVAIHDRCREEGIPVWCGGMLESGIGRSYNVALASLPNFSLPGDLSPSRRYWARDIVDPEWTMSDHGQVQVPLHRPGLGVEVDRDRIEHLTVNRERMEG